MGGQADEYREQLAAAAHAKASVERLDVDVDGVRAEPEAGGNFLLAVAGEKAIERLAHARGERDFVGGGRLAVSEGSCTGWRATVTPQPVTDNLAQVGNQVAIAGAFVG